MSDEGGSSGDAALTMEASATEGQHTDGGLSPSAGTPAGRTTGVAAVLAGLATALLTGVTTQATVVGLGGVVVLLASLYRSSRVLATVGAAALFGSVILAGVAGAGAGQLLAGGAGAVLAWTFAHAAIDLRVSVGVAPTQDHELAHVTGTTAIVAGGAVPIYVVYSIDWGTVPPVAVALLLVGAVALTAALRR